MGEYILLVIIYANSGAVAIDHVRGFNSSSACENAGSFIIRMTNGSPASARYQCVPASSASGSPVTGPGGRQFPDTGPTPQNPVRLPR